MTASDGPDVTALLADLRDGVAGSADRLAAVVMDELHRIAEGAMRREAAVSWRSKPSGANWGTRSGFVVPPPPPPMIGGVTRTEPEPDPLPAFEPPLPALLVAHDS